MTMSTMTHTIYTPMAESCMEEASDGTVVYRGVPLLGEYSPNGGIDPYHTCRDYSEAIRRPETAAAMEGSAYLMGHSERASVMPLDVIGVVENVRYGSARNGRNYLMGDVRLIKNNAEAIHAMKLIKIMPQKVGSSVEYNECNYTLESRGPDTVMKIKSIPKFRGVGFVIDPATTKGFFESQEDRKMDQKPEQVGANVLALYTEALSSLKISEAATATLTAERDALKARVTALEAELEGVRKVEAIVAEAGKRKLTLTEAEMGIAKALPSASVTAYIESLAARVPAQPATPAPFAFGSPLVAGAVSQQTAADPLDLLARSIGGAR